MGSAPFPDSAPAVNPFIRKAQRAYRLDRDEQQAIVHGAARTVGIGQGEDIVRDGQRPKECALLLDGFACRYKVMLDGKRQIFALQIPGDFCDLQSYLLRRADHSIGALTPCTFALYPHAAIRDIIARYPRLGEMFWMETLLDGAICREWMAGIGRRSAHARIAHFFCEMLVRLREVGLARADGYELPVTQSDMGDALGLSTVHVNRVLKQLREDGLVTHRGGTIVIHDFEELARAAEFSADYLQPMPGRLGQA